jgi:hypothetical protein
MLHYRALPIIPARQPRAFLFDEFSPGEALPEFS